MIGVVIGNFNYFGDNLNVFTQGVLTKRRTHTACRPRILKKIYSKGPHWIGYYVMKPLY